MEAARRGQAARRAAAEQASAQLAASRADVLGSQLPTLLRYQVGGAAWTSAAMGADRVRLGVLP